MEYSNNNSSEILESNVKVAQALIIRERMERRRIEKIKECEERSGKEEGTNLEKSSEKRGK